MSYKSRGHLTSLIKSLKDKIKRNSDCKIKQTLQKKNSPTNKFWIVTFIKCYLWLKLEFLSTQTLTLKRGFYGQTNFRRPPSCLKKSLEMKNMPLSKKPLENPRHNYIKSGFSSVLNNIVGGFIFHFFNFFNYKITSQWPPPILWLLPQNCQKPSFS